MMEYEDRIVNLKTGFFGRFPQLFSTSVFNHLGVPASGFRVDKAAPALLVWEGTRK
jgi:hypothetical protein